MTYSGVHSSRWIGLAAGTVLALLPLAPAEAFCGFYVAKADTDLFNEASKVVLVRDGDRTVVTMASDYRGAASEFAMVVPVPTVLEEGQIHVADNDVVDHLDAYTSPRLVEYFDPDPCRTYDALEDGLPLQGATGAPIFGNEVGYRDRKLGVTVEAEYTVGEYNILILSAEESDGLQTWLDQNGYKTPPEAIPVLADYIAKGMKFFVAEVNLEEQARIGAEYLRPIQIAFESEEFMLPIRLGMVNAAGPQEMFVFALTRTGRVETANYETVELPSSLEVPIFVREEFGDFYNAMFDTQYVAEHYDAAFLEYAWDMAWCDPCAADPLSVAELKELGVFWLDGNDNGRTASPAQDVFVTRLHMRYDKENFPTDIAFEETGDRENYQGRYILRHPRTGEPQCEAAEAYLGGLPKRFSREAITLADLTGWDIDMIFAKMEDNGQSLDGRPVDTDPRPWWQRLWQKG